MTPTPDTRRLLTLLFGTARDVAIVGAALSAFEVGAQADDTAVLAVERIAVGERAVSLNGGRAGSGQPRP